MSSLNIFGIYALDGMPMLEALELGLSNENHTNLIELARANFAFHANHGRIYAGIVVIVNSDEAYVYTFK